MGCNACGKTEATFEIIGGDAFEAIRDEVVQIKANFSERWLIIFNSWTKQPTCQGCPKCYVLYIHRYKPGRRGDTRSLYVKV